VVRLKKTRRISPAAGKALVAVEIGRLKMAVGVGMKVGTVDGNAGRAITAAGGMKAPQGI